MNTDVNIKCIKQIFFNYHTLGNPTDGEFRFPSSIRTPLREALKSQKVAITHLAIGIDTQFTYHIVAMKKVAE